MVQKYGSEAMKRPVEIEFACNLYRGDEGVSGDLYLLQIRPIVDSKQVLDEDLPSIPDERCLLRSDNSLGHGISEDVYDVVYVKADETFTAANNPTIASEIERINQRFLDGEYPAPDGGEGGGSYVLVGPGRWGSSDYWLGIPVKWPHISAARVIVEAGLKNYHVDPSQGTHFFQNLTSFGVGYFTINFSRQRPLPSGCPRPHARRRGDRACAPRTLPPSAEDHDGRQATAGRRAAAGSTG